ncbi:MAG: hypothetical protein IJ736_12090 [Firmicutes bacterium]|nr:hypothetical protein [Bacillota bacterium]
MTTHQIVNANSNYLSFLNNNSINLIVTSPPYPMIEMWDKLFIEQDISIQEDLNNGDGNASFIKMHNLLNKTWKECDRVLADHGFICINIGDATRTINGNFQLYSNHSKIIDFFHPWGIVYCLISCGENPQIHLINSWGQEYTRQGLMLHINMNTY